MNGTAWTEPGQGATVYQLRLMLFGSSQFSNMYDEINQPVAKKALGRLFSRHDDDERTNLRLTGSPLTAEDLKRIEQAEVTR